MNNIFLVYEVILITCCAAIALMFFAFIYLVQIYNPNK
jgi:hypothetical protein